VGGTIKKKHKKKGPKKKEYEGKVVNFKRKKRKEQRIGDNHDLYFGGENRAGRGVVSSKKTKPRAPGGVKRGTTVQRNRA